MKLYQIPGSCSLAAHIVLLESGLPFETVTVDFNTRQYDGEQDYYKISEFGYVPALELDSGEIFREAVVILQIIADQVPQKMLVPENGTLARYRLQEWLNFLSSEIHKGFILPRYREQNQDYFDVATKKLYKRYQWLDAQLATKPYLMGDTFTIADVYLYVMTNWCRADWLKSVFGFGIELSSLQHIAAWHKRIAGRAAVRAATQAEGLSG